MDRLAAIDTFIRVADAGSFHRAASQQGITPQAVSKAIRLLERSLGTRLFHRSTRSSRLTDEGRHFLERVRPGVQQIEAAWAEARQLTRDDAGLIRITAPRLVGQHVLVPLLAEWQAWNPGIEFDLVIEDAYTDLEGSGVHLGFRAGQPPARDLIVRELFRLQLIICAAPHYLERHGIPQQREELIHHRLTGSRQPRTGRLEPWEFIDNGKPLSVALPSVFCSNDAESEADAVSAGLGIGQLDSITAAARLRGGALVPLMLDQVSERHGLYLYYPPRAELPQRVHRFIDHVRATLADGHAYRLSRPELAALQQRSLSALGAAGADQRRLNVTTSTSR